MSFSRPEIPVTFLIERVHTFLTTKVSALADLPIWLVALVFLVITSFIVTQIAAVIGGIMTYLERRVAARIQFRIGPNRVGPQGILQFLADGVKLVLKEDLIPAVADKPLFRLAPYLVVVGTFLAFVTLPLAQNLILSDLNVGILYILSITSFVVVGILMSGWASNSKWSLLGSLRSAAQIISYEIPIGIAVLNAVMVSGSLSMQKIIGSQGAYPWQWNMFYNPFIFISTFIYFTAALAEINRTPFDIPEAESELVSGYNTEYSGIRFGLFFMAEFANVFLISAICTTLFLGGWQLPGAVTTLLTGSALLLALAQLSVFMVKVGALCFLILQIRWTLPRLRVDQLMATCWKYLVPVAFVNLVGTAIWMALWPTGLVGVSVVLTLFAVGVLGYYIYCIVHDLKVTNAVLRFNPLS